MKYAYHEIGREPISSIRIFGQAKWPIHHLTPLLLSAKNTKSLKMFKVSINYSFQTVHKLWKHFLSYNPDCIFFYLLSSVPHWSFLANNSLLHESMNSYHFTFNQKWCYDVWISVPRLFHLTSLDITFSRNPYYY